MNVPNHNKNQAVARISRPYAPHSIYSN